MRTLSLLRLKLLQLLLLPPAALIIATDRTLTHSHAHARRVGRNARTHHSHCRHAHKTQLCYVIIGTTLQRSTTTQYTAQTTVQLI